MSADTICLPLTSSCHHYIIAEESSTDLPLIEYAGILKHYDTEIMKNPIRNCPKQKMFNLSELLYLLSSSINCELWICAGCSCSPRGAMLNPVCTPSQHSSTEEPVLNPLCTPSQHSSTEEPVLNPVCTHSQHSSTEEPF
ncbi:hypothetical protein EOD39_6774 [Acipenser ruthenus]|uniref:Uncharacterized protein n=1 Tax=Acipenser ruthenus TaxID=7906 RepID=A0A662YY79_ACIRT|nr:hypothetical protein EOD39_6774 [Acipenser ruthenus]